MTDKTTQTGETLEALMYEENGDPCTVVRVVPISEPLPQAGEVVVEMEAIPLHIADLKAIRGNLPFAPKGPGCPGFEGVGRIVSCGQGVTGWKAGDRVILPLFYGTCRARLAVPATGLWRAPEAVPAEQLALVRVNMTTAYLLLHAYLDLQPGDWVIQNAANSNVAGFVGILADQIGVNVIYVVRRPELILHLKQRGIAHVALDDPRSIEAICREVGASPRLALDAIGGAATARLAHAAADRGLVLAYGFLSEEAYQIHYEDAMFRNVRLEVMTINSSVLKMDTKRLQLMSDRIEAIIGIVELNAEIAGIYSFSEHKAAFAAAAQTGAKRAGKVILKPS